MTTVNEMLTKLKQLAEEGKGAYPVQFMDVRRGVPYAIDLRVCEAQPYDGERVWLIPTKETAPEYLAEYRKSVAGR